jgi:alpha-ketoglutaric semialdehyde dehydrogenase
MTSAPHGRHLIAGDWVASTETFPNAPISGAPALFSAGTVEQVDAACRAAEAAFAAYSATSREVRAVFLETIAEEIDARGATITEIGTLETGLPAGRLEGERGRTTGQLRLFASHIRKGDYLDRRTDAALPDRTPMPRPEIRLMQMPVGPVAVFGASNFPLAFSTAGGDTASALAAGCPVVVKGHSAHPGTAEVVAEAVLAAILRCDMPKGVFSLIQGGSRKVGEAVVTHPAIRAVGFTGSLAGGRALFNLCAARPDPIPFFGELGSVNPMFLMPAALTARGDAIAKGWAGSLTMGAGQFCTNPGIAVVIDGPEAAAFTAAAKAAVEPTPPQIMLTDGIASAYRQGRDRIAGTAGVREVLTSTCDLRQATPYLFAVSGDDWLANHALGEEVFGPLGLIVTVRDFAQMLAVANSLEGQLTCTLHVDAADHAQAAALMPTLARKAGRVLANGFPTGVEVSEAMVHGGPYPASTNFGATSVGTMSIRRFLRPVSFQNMPEALLPEDLR